MRQITIFATLCSLVAVLALPTPQHATDQVSNAKLSEKIHIANTLNSLDLMNLSTQDYMANLIYALLKITAGQFLTSIDNAMRSVQNEINQGMIELQQLKHRLDPTTQQKLQNVINKALDEALNSITPILNDLGMVLPSITRSSSLNTRGVSDVIYILLQMSFEDFLHKIATVMDRSMDILATTMGELSNIANTIPDSTVANDLRRIANIRLERARSLIRPVLTDLKTVIPSKGSIDVMTHVISKAVGFDVVVTAIKLDMVLEQVETTMTGFVKKINNILGLSHPNIRNEVNQILKESINNVESTIEPILKVFLHFVPASDDIQDRRGDYKDIVSTLLGVSLEDFLFYVDFAIPRIQDIYNKAVIDIRNSCISSQPFLLIQILQLIDGTMDSLESSVEPFISQISPILGDKRWVTYAEFVEITKDDNNERDNVFCNFSLRSGYNKDLIIHLISKVFGFDIVAAATEMSNSLHEMDTLYTASSIQLNELVSSLHPFVAVEVNRILSNSLNITRQNMLPAIGVFIEFLPAEGRQEKDIVGGIVHALDGLKYEQFKNYVQIATEKSGEVAQSTLRHIHQIVESGKPHKTTVGQPPNDSLLDQVDAIMTRTLRATQNISKPFYERISPIFES